MTNLRNLKKDLLMCIKNRETYAQELSEGEKLAVVKISISLFSSFSLPPQEKAVLASILSELNIGRPAGEWAQDIVLTKKIPRKKQPKPSKVKQIIGF